jgi:hypothetical protein
MRLDVTEYTELHGHAPAVLLRRCRHALSLAADSRLVQG